MFPRLLRHAFSLAVTLDQSQLPNCIPGPVDKQKLARRFTAYLQLRSFDARNCAARGPTRREIDRVTRSGAWPETEKAPCGDTQRYLLALRA